MVLLGSQSERLSDHTQAECCRQGDIARPIEIGRAEGFGNRVPEAMRRAGNEEEPRYLYRGSEIDS